MQREDPRPSAEPAPRPTGPATTDLGSRVSARYAPLVREETAVRDRTARNPTDADPPGT